MSFKKQGLSIILVFAAVLLPVLLVTVLLWSASQNEAQAADRIRATAMGQALAGELDRQLELRMRQVFSLAALPSFRGFAAAEAGDRAARATVALREMQALVSADSHIREVQILDATGATVLTTYQGFGQNWSQRAFVATALRGGIDASPPGRDDGEISVFYASPILNNSGDVAGVLMLRVSAQEIWQPVNSAREDCCYAVLTDEYGVRLADAGDPARAFRAWAPLDSRLIQRLVTAQQYGAEMTQFAATNLPTVNQQLTRPTPPSVIESDSVSGPVTLLKNKPWTVLVVTAPATTRPSFWYAAGTSLILGLACAFGLLIWMKRTANKMV